MKMIILGAGTYAEVYLSYLREFSNHTVVGFLDDNPDLLNKEVQSIPVLGDTRMMPQLAQQGIEGVFCPIGDNESRVRLLTQARDAGLQTPSFIHPSSNVSRDVNLGRTVYILAGTTIMPYATLEDGVMVSTMVSIAHHAVLREGVFASMACKIGAGIDVGRCAFLGIGCALMTGIKAIGENSLVGIGAVAIRDVPPHAVVAGVPAKVLRYQD